MDKTLYALLPILYFIQNITGLADFFIDVKGDKASIFK